jgi:hypothetical protein
MISFSVDEELKLEGCWHEAPARVAAEGQQGAVKAGRGRRTTAAHL